MHINMQAKTIVWRVLWNFVKSWKAVRCYLMFMIWLSLTYVNNCHVGYTACSRTNDWCSHSARFADK